MKLRMLSGAAVLAVMGVLAVAGAAGGQTQRPDWLRKPSPEDFNAVLPARAMDQQVSGGAVIQCEVNLRGLLENCSVLSENPAGYGFGEAALMLAPAFQMKPAMQNGKPVRSSVRIPISFDLHALADFSGFSMRMVRDPAWATAPTRAEMAAAWPAKAGEKVQAAQVVLRCHFKSDGTLRSCDVISEDPKGHGFADAAIRLAQSRFKAVVAPGEETEAAKIWVTLPIHFDRPNGAGPVAPSIAHPHWVRSLNPAAVETFYPAAAKAAGVRTGVGMVECLVADDGNLVDCKVISETPAGLGFGDAALKVSGVMQMNRWTQDGGPVGGARIRLPLRLTLPDEAPKPASSDPAKP